MNIKEKGKFNEALRLYDNKDYKNAKKSCEKILDKQPSHSDAMALKGLILTHQGEKTEGVKIINQAIRLNFSNPNSWHFFALFHKEDKNYAQAMKCYMQAMKNDSENFNVIRDLSYLQLYLRQYNAFLDSAKRSVAVRSNLLLNWATYSFANYLIGNYELAFTLLESTKNIGLATIKPQEKHEIILFQTMLLEKNNKSEEALNFLLDNQNAVSLDKTIFTEKVVHLSQKCDKNDLALVYVNKALQINSENVNYFIDYFNIKADLKLKSFEDLIRLYSQDKSKTNELYKILQKEIKPVYMSRLINRLELALSDGEDFKKNFNSYFLFNVRQNLPSFFNNVKFIYLSQTEKISIVEEILFAHLDSIEKSKKLDLTLTSGEEMDIEPNIIWTHYYAAQHFDQIRDLERALKHINIAIDSTPSVVEFYMIKSKVLKHSGLLEESATCYEKAKKLDTGDRYLNAKYAKIYTRLGNVAKSEEIMKEFVKDPLTDDNIEHFQCMWYEVECGYSYLKNKNVLRSHRLFKAVLGHFSTVIEDQFDFYNYCLRRYMLNEFAKTIEHMDRILDNKYVYKSLEALEVILKFLRSNKSKEMEKSLLSEFESMKAEKIEKYKYTDINGLITEVENDLFNICVRLQTYSKNIGFHHLCVKTFLEKGKFLLAFKSLIFLQDSYNKNGNHEFLSAVNLFYKELQKSKDSQNSLHINIFFEKCPLLKNEEELQTYIRNENEKISEKLVSQGNHLANLVNEAYESYFNSSSPMEKVFEKFLNFSQKELRGVKSVDLNILHLYLNLVADQETSKTLTESYKKLIKLNCEEDEVSKNIRFYE